MMIDNPCKFDLQSVLDESCAPDQQQKIENHLEGCEQCQQKLDGLAADSTLWSQVSSHLSTVEQISLSQQVSNRLNTSNSFVIPSVDGEHNAGIGPTSADWTKVLDPPSHPETLGRIDQFEIESKIGQGGMGIVLKGFDRGLNRAVAIKLLAPHLAANGTARKRFAREAQAAAAVVHPNVVRIHSVQKSADRPYIVMELGPSETLQSLVQQNGPAAATDVVRIALQIASGLDAAHKIGLIHRDVKPGNILVEQDVSRVMITDFGLARAVDDAGMTQTGWIAGTPHYMSPEQAKGDDLDERTDLFSLGSLMYFLATGRQPFRGDKPYAVIQKIISTDPTNATESNSEVPIMLSDIIEKLLEKDAKDRFQSAGDLIEVLQQYLAHLQQPKKTLPPKPVLTVRKKKKRAWTIGVGVAIAVAGMIIGAAIWMPGSTATKTPKPVPISSAPASSALPRTQVFQFNDNEYMKELTEISKEMDALERSFGSFGSNSEPTFYEPPADIQHSQLPNTTVEKLIDQVDRTNNRNTKRDKDEK